MMNNKNLARLAILTLCLTFVSTSLLGGTLAKYTSEVTATGTATVADWEITVNDNEITVASAPTVTFDLFTTSVNDTLNNFDETDVGDDLIAPGTTGEFAFKIENKSEVNARYTIELSETTTSGIPIQYSTNGTAWHDDIADLEADLTGDLAMGASTSGTTSTTVKWRWAFDTTTSTFTGQTDDTDTALGIAAKTSSDELGISAKITVTQVD